MESNHPELTVLEQHQIAEFGLAERDCLLQHGLEYRFQLARRARDDAEDLGGRRLLLQRLAQIIGALPQLVEQPRVLDGDDGLRGEIRHEPNLLVAEGRRLLTKDIDRTDQLVLPQHWHGYEGSCAAKLEPGIRRAFALDVGLLCGKVENVDHRLAFGDASERHAWMMIA